MRLTGLTAAPFTPFRPDGSLNLAAVPEQCALLVESGVTGAFVCGTTGESALLTTTERMAVADAWVTAAAGRLKVIVHAGHNSSVEAAGLAAHAASIGADAVAATPPGFFKPATASEVADCLAPVAAAGRLPFYYYDIPSMTGVTVPAADVLAALADRVPNVAGVKFTNPDLQGLQECLHLRNGAFDVVFGKDEMLLGALALGARGAVGSTYNYAAPLYLRLLAAFDAGDLATARALQFQSVRIVRQLDRFRGAACGKAIMQLMGLDVGPTRPPIRPLSAAETAAVFDGLAGIEGFARPLVRPA